MSLHKIFINCGDSLLRLEIRTTISLLWKIQNLFSISHASNGPKPSSTHFSRARSSLRQCLSPLSLTRQARQLGGFFHLVPAPVRQLSLTCSAARPQDTVAHSFAPNYPHRLRLLLTHASNPLTAPFSHAGRETRASTSFSPRPHVLRATT